MRWLAILLFLSPDSFAYTERCTPYSPADKPLTRAPRVLQNEAELMADRDLTYATANRLKGRAHKDGAAMVIPYAGGLIDLPASFTAGVGAHLHKALVENYADAVVYADMGHMHLLVPDSEWASLRDQAGGVRMGAVLNAPTLKALYHTAEMVQLKDGDFAKGRLSADAWKQWRYFTRNLLGGFGVAPGLDVLLDALEAMYNTVRELPGFTQVSTLYISANRAACFPFRDAGGHERFFDMTFEEIPYSKP